MLKTDRYASEGIFLSYRREPWCAQPGRSLFIECATCGFEPEDQTKLPNGRCPKCRRYTWCRVIRPHSLVRGPHE